jgi:type I restriction enzyme S subunit
MFGLDPDTLRKIRACFAQFPQIHKVLLYGSRAMGTQQTGSDVDISLIGQDLSRKNTLHPLSEALDELLLPFTFDVSIFTQLKKPELIQHILERGVCLYQTEVVLKEGWKVKTLGELCENLDSQRVPITKSKRETGDIPYYGASGIVDYVKDFIFDENLLLVSEDGANLLARTTPIAFQISGKTWVNNHAHALRFPNKTLQALVEYYLNATKLDDYISGMAQPKLNQKKLNSITIPVPPLAEQESIVALLDKAFAAIDQAKSNLETNIANAKELFQSKLNAIFSQKGDGWVETTLGNVTGGVLTGPFGSLLHKSDYIENGIPLINPAHITETGIAPDINKTVTTETTQRLKNYKLKTGDIIIGRRGEMGRCAVVTENEAGWICGTGSFIIKHSPRVESEYLVRLLRSQKIREELEIIASGAVMKNLSNKSLSNFVISVPPLETQQSALSQFNSLCSERRQLEAIYLKKLTALDELKKSILQKSFAGELTE